MISPEEKAAKKAGYTATLDEALTAGTGMNAEQREDFRNDVDHWLDVRKKAKKGSKKFKEAEAQIKRLMGWG